MDTKHERRIAQNESLFRTSNDRTTGAVTDFHDGRVPAAYRIMCECAITECADMLDIQPGAYEAVRSDPRRFIVKPGHSTPGAERTIERNHDYWVLEKTGAGVQVARDHAAHPHHNATNGRGV